MPKILILLLIVSNVEAQAKTCDELQRTVVELEAVLKSSQRPACKDENSTKTEDKDYCVTLFQAELDYNKALAEVNIYESLNALAHTIDNDHRALKEITQKQLSESKELVSNLDYNFNKADLLSTSFDMIKNEKNTGATNIWVGYKGEKPEEISAYLEGKCQEKSAPGSEKLKYETFCNKYYDLESNKEDVLKTLSNFVNSDRKINYDIGDRKANYEDYQEYLKITESDTGKKLTINEYKSLPNGNYKKFQELKKLIEEYEVALAPEVGTKILKLSKELNGIKMNYSQGVEIRQSFADNVKKELAEDLTNISTLSGRFLNDEYLKNKFESTQKSLEIDVKNKKSLLLKSINDTPAFKKLCEAKKVTDPVLCISNICNKTSAGCTVSDADKSLVGGVDLNGLGLGTLNTQTNDLIKAESFANTFNLLSQCFTKKTLKEKEACFNEHKQKLKDENLISNTFDEAKQKLQKSINVINELNKTEDVQRFKLQKLVALSAMEKEGCLTKEQHMESSRDTSYCDIAAIDNHHAAAISLSTDIGDIVVTYKKDSLLSIYKDLYGAENKVPKYLAAFQKDCQQKNVNTMTKLCEYLETQDAYRENIKQEIEDAKKRKQQQEQDRIAALQKEFQFEYDDSNEAEMSGLGYAGAGLASGLVKNMGNLFSYMNTRKNHKNYMTYQNNMLSYYQNMYSANTTHTMNWINWNYDGISPTSFQSTPYQYLDTSNINYSLNTIPFSYTMNNGATYVPSTTTTTTTSGTSTGYNFSY